MPGISKRFDVRITIFYSIVASLWIVFTDSLLNLAFAGNPAMLGALSGLKGLGFVLVTTFALFTILHAELQKRDRLEQRLQQDILERTHTLEVLRDSERRFTSVFNNSPVATGISRRDDSYIVDVNDAFVKLFGYERHELIGHTGFELGIWVDPEQRTSAVESVSDLGIAHNLEIEGRTKSGNIISLLWSVQRIDLGNVPHLVSMFYDVTEQKNLETQRHYQALLLANVSDAVISTDVNFNVLSWNPAAETIYGWTSDEVIGKPLREIIGVDYHFETREETLNHLRTYGSWHGENLHHRKDGTGIYSLASVSYVNDSMGNRVGLVSVSRDVTERRQMEAALSAERNLLRTLIDHMPDYIFVKDNERRYSLSNQAHNRAAGVNDSSELIGKLGGAFFPKDYVSQHDEDDQVVLNGKSIIAQERQTVSEDGSVIWVSTTKIPLRDELGNIIGIVGISRNINDYKQAEETLKEERNLLRTLIDTVPANVYIKDTQSRFVDANTETILRMGVQSASDLIGKTDFDFFPPELATKYFADEQRVIQSGQTLMSLEEPTIDLRTQEHIWILTTKAPIHDEQGVVTGLVGVGLEITGRKRAEEALRENEAKLQSFFEVLPVGISVLDHEHRIVEMNPALERILDISREDVVAGVHQSRKYINSDGVPMQAGDLPSARARAEQRTVHDVVIGVVKDDETTIWTSVSAAPLPLANSMVITATADITERKQAEEQALTLRAERQRVNLLREFITDVSHDFRTPLTMIGTSAFLITKTNDTDKLAQCSQRIEDQINRLRLLLDNFVELAHLEQAASSIPVEPTNLDMLMRVLLEDLMSEAAYKHQHIEYVCETSPVLADIDPAAFTKVINNVVANAILYTPDNGNITIRLGIEDKNAVIQVSDTGIGIKAEDLPHIFESFYRVDNARSSVSGGAGLGLPVAKKIIEMMSGHISVASEFGRGSVFTIYLPLYRAALTNTVTQFSLSTP